MGNDFQNIMGPVVSVKCSCLYPHEEVDTERVIKIINEIRKTNTLKFPIIVDENSYVIIDGHHRFRGLFYGSCIFNKLPF